MGKIILGISFNRLQVQTDDHYNVAVFDPELNLVERMSLKLNNDRLSFRTS